jgi:hypothetical protein
MDKQRVNFAREWPPPQPEDEPTEHVRENVDLGTGGIRDVERLQALRKDLMEELDLPDMRPGDEHQIFGEITDLRDEITDLRAELERHATRARWLNGIAVDAEGLEPTPDEHKVKLLKDKGLIE